MQTLIIILAITSLIVALLADYISEKKSNKRNVPLQIKCHVAIVLCVLSGFSLAFYAVLFL